MSKRESKKEAGATCSRAEDARRWRGQSADARVSTEQPHGDTAYKVKVRASVTCGGRSSKSELGPKRSKRVESAKQGQGKESKLVHVKHGVNRRVLQ